MTLVLLFSFWISSVALAEQSTLIDNYPWLLNQEPFLEFFKTKYFRQILKGLGHNVTKIGEAIEKDKLEKREKKKLPPYVVQKEMFYYDTDQNTHYFAKQKDAKEDCVIGYTCNGAKLFSVEDDKLVKAK
eukprot:Pgem_evm1s7963